LVVQIKKGGGFGLFMDRGGIKGNEQGIKCTGISTIYWNHNAFCGHSLAKPHGTIFGLGSNISHKMAEDRTIRRFMINLWLAFSPVIQRNSPRLINIKRFNDLSKGEQQHVKDGKVMHQG